MTILVIATTGKSRDYLLSGRNKCGLFSSSSKGSRYIFNMKVSIASDHAGFTLKKGCIDP